MTLRIVTDSASDLPPEVVAEHAITVVPAFVNAGGREYRDGVDITREEFYERLPRFEPLPGTAAPGPELFRQTYARLAEEGATEILSVHIASNLSAMFNSALAGAREAPLPVTVFDTQQVSMGTGFMAWAAAQAARAGWEMGRIVEHLRAQAPRTFLYAALDTLEYLRRGGRVNAVAAGLGSLLQVKLLVTVHLGQLTTERVRTRSQAIRRLIDLLYNRLPLEKVAVMHTRARERAEELLAEVRHLLPPGDIPIVEATPAIGVHAGPGALGFVCVTAAEAA